MTVVARIEKYMADKRVDEAVMFTRKHYVWFLEIFVEAAKKVGMRRIMLLDMINILVKDFVQTNPQFKETTFLQYAKKLVMKDAEEDLEMSIDKKSQIQ